MEGRYLYCYTPSLKAYLGKLGILGTVAFKIQQSRRHPRHSLDIPGAYVAAMAVKGRQGKWLSSRRDIAQLIELLGQYLDTFKAWKIHRDNPQTPEHSELNLFAKEIDIQYGQRHAKKPFEMRFVRESSVWKVNGYGPGITTDGGTIDEIKDAEKYVRYLEEANAIFRALTAASDQKSSQDDTAGDNDDGRAESDGAIDDNGHGDNRQDDSDEDRSHDLGHDRREIIRNSDDVDDNDSDNDSDSDMDDATLLRKYA